ncbi:hypothetical protein GCM10028773_17750 [Spirosoma koreense]
MNEPCHIHAGDDGVKLCKYWIREDGSFLLADSVKIKVAERKKIEKAIREHIRLIMITYESDCQTSGIKPNYYNQAK